MQIEKSFSRIDGVSPSTSSVRTQLIESLRTSKEYRHAFVDEKIRTGLAAQMRAMREKLDGMTQEKFARILGKSQSWVARLEDPNEPPPTLSTLLRVAWAFDVGLDVRFAPFSELVDWISGTPHLLPGLSPESLAVADFEHDLGLQPRIEIPRLLARMASAYLVSRPEMQWLQLMEQTPLSRASERIYIPGPASGVMVAPVKPAPPEPQTHLVHAANQPGTGSQSSLLSQISA